MPRATKKTIVPPAELPPAEEKAETRTKSVRYSGRPSATLTLSVMLVVALSAAGYFFVQYRKTPQMLEMEEIERLVEEVGEKMELPGGEVPTLATVTNREKLDDQPFFKRAENGDKILIYKLSGRAILYRPGTGKILDVTAVNIETEKPAGSAAASASEPVVAPVEPVSSVETPAVPVSADVPLPVAKANPEIILYNGSGKVGITNVFEKTLLADFPEAIVVAKETAGRNDYTKSIVVDMSGEAAAAATEIARRYGATLGELPDGETPGSADIIIILGADRK